MQRQNELISLNFLPVQGVLPSFQIFRKQVESDSESRPNEDVKRYSLPIDDSEDSARSFYWISFEDKPGFERFTVHPDYNLPLTKWVLLKSIQSSFLTGERKFQLKDRIHESVEITMKGYPEGWDMLSLEPYYLKSEGVFGVIVDFHFRKKREIPFSRAVQQRSLSLTSQFRRNFNFHLDKLARITTYLNSVRDSLNTTQFPGDGATVTFSRDFLSIPVSQLNHRRYRFGGNSEQASQYAGVKEFGPFSKPAGPTKLIFAFLAEHHQSAVRFVNALTGRKNLGGYQGYEKLFRTQVEVSPTPVTLSDFSSEEIERVLQRVHADDPNPLAVFILPDDDEERYFKIKAAFAAAGVPNQACRVQTISSDDDLKWSIANLGLQIFCKCGGQPWQVRAETSEALIVGISQSHKINDAGSIERFFAFSVLTDNSGVFKSIRVLADSSDHTQYIQALKETLSEELSIASHDYQRVAIHASFKLRIEEMAAIEDVVRGASDQQQGCGFSVLKINQKTRFFGTNSEVNSLVPYEGSFTRLGGNEFLIWFEGIERARKTATKAYPGPTHVQVLWKSSGDQTSDEDLVQDLMTLSGANWRGFNARSSPVSVYYCQLVAELVHDFQIRQLSLPSVEGLRPWFL